MNPVMIFKKEQRWLTLLALLTLIALFAATPAVQAQSYRNCPPPWDAANYGSPLNLSRCNLDFIGDSLSSANLINANIREATMWEINLSGADLSGANLTDTELLFANLDDADLSNATLSKAVLLGASLRRADLGGAILRSTVLAGVKLNDADLSGADLTDFTNLSDANLTGANLTNADLTNADLSGVVWSNTTCPDGSNSSANNPETCFPDTIPPVITPNVSGPLGDNGWYVSDVTVSFTCADEAGGSGIATDTVAGTTLSSEGTDQSVTNSGECTDNTGNTASSVTVSGINIDKTAPTASATVSPAANANGWYNSDVMVSFSGSDDLSGLATCDPDVILSGEGSGQSATGTCTDNAGHVTTILVSDINIDKAAPVVSVTGVEDGATYSFGAAPAAGCQTSDALSGVATQAGLTISGGNPDGSGSFTATCDGASDNAGNSAGPVSVSYTVEPADDTPPVITPNVSGTMGNNGWYLSDVTAGWTVSDDESTISSTSGCETTTVTSDTAGTTLTCEATSDGGTNSASVTIKRDATAPIVNVTGVADGATYILGSVPTAGCDTQDALSGVATVATLALSGGNPDGTGSITATCAGAVDNADNSGSASVTYNVVYDFSGFVSPIDNLPTVNGVKAGQAVPVKFSLNGDQGLDILASGYPASQEVACDSNAPVDDVEETSTAGNSSLSYDPASDLYSYTWKTEKGWQGTCRLLIVKFIDGSEHSAMFQFK